MADREQLLPGTVDLLIRKAVSLRPVQRAALPATPQEG